MIKQFLLVMVLIASSAMSKLNAGPLAFGGGAGVDLPFYHENTYDPGVSAEAFWRKDQYEIRFHFADTQTQTYSFVMGIKHFFSDSALRPYVEGAAGPLIVDPKGKGLAYGARPEAALGADLGLSQNLSVGFVTRYYGMIYFGDTHSGKFEANHGMTVLVNLIFWF